MQVYWMSVFKIPISVIQDIEKILKTFLWDQNGKVKGKAKVSWKEVCRPKDQGDLVLKNLAKWNDVLLIKHIWDILNNKDTIWVKWIKCERLTKRSF